MTPIDRNPDIDLDTQEVPSGMQLIKGKNLMHTARSAKVPFGVASQLNRITFNSRPETIGLIIRDEDVERFNAALEKKLARKKHEDKIK
jgi:hypothetical protein